MIDPVDQAYNEHEAEQGREAEFDARVEKGFAQADADHGRIADVKLEHASGMFESPFPQQRRTPDEIAQGKRLLAAALANIDKMKQRVNA